MADDPERRVVRLRLARRRTAPVRVRARVREEDESPEPDASADADPEPDADADFDSGESSRLRRGWLRLRRAKWAHIITVVGTALGALAAVGGLWAQAVATYWSQQAAKDQLQQSREDGEREKRAQATAVSYWPEYDGDHWKLHVQNRSADPAPNLQLAFVHVVVVRRFAVPPGPTRILNPEPVVFLLNTHRLGPCTELIYSSKQIEKDIFPKGDLENQPSWIFQRSTRFIYVIGAEFSDRDGQFWLRTPTKLELSTRRGIPIPVRYRQDAVGGLVDEPEVKKVALCGDGA
ncbi:hypothetical protein [Streptomyces siamensis]|uniref:Uncharacterized protein n=1 Tax=Streptomyces siamensis TaxID=1274986 RepID=A0ABP9JHM8_9ACTN